MTTDHVDDLHAALNEWFEYTQEGPDDNPNFVESAAVRSARYIGTLEMLIVAVTAGDKKATLYVTDRLRAGLKAFK